MTTVVAIRNKEGVYVASDTMSTIKICEGYELKKPGFKKHIQYKSGFIGFAGSACITAEFIKSLSDGSIAPNLEFKTKEEVRSELEKSFGLIKDNLEIQFAPTEEDKWRGPEWLKLSGKDEIWDSMLKNSITFFYMDFKKAIHGLFSIEKGLEQLYLYCFEVEDDDGFCYYHIGSGADFASEYIERYFESGYDTYEIIKNSILYATTKDSHTGYGVNIESKLIN